MEPQLKNIKSDQTLILPAPPSAIERSSVSPSSFIVGTYSLDTAEDSTTSASRSGSLCVIAPSGPDLTKYSISRSYPTISAVLDVSIDLKTAIIAVANSTGAIELWKEEEDPANPHVPVLTHQRTVQAFPEAILVLSLHQHPREERRNVFAVSLSDGSLAVIDTTQPNPVIWHEEAHSLEAWTVRWKPELVSEQTLQRSRGIVESLTLLSGGDDSVLRQTPLPGNVFNSGALGPERDEEEESFPVEPPVINRRTHQAGVTAILPLAYHPDRPSSFHSSLSNVFITGSYDDHIRVMNGQRCLSELKLDGGVWRLLLIGRQGGIEGREIGDDGERWWVLASCMYAGCRVLEISGQNLLKPDKWNIRLLATFNEHESMNYASTIVKGMKTENKEAESALEGLTVISTSFYDKRFCIWRLQSLGSKQ